MKYLTLVLILQLSLDAAPVWVSHDFMGGPKCVSSGPISHYQAPGFESEKHKLKTAGVMVAREFFRDKATCQACYSCPNYSREILFEIDTKHTAAADKAGYRKAANPPGTEELQTYEEGKKFKPKPDVPVEE